MTRDGPIEAATERVIGMAPDLVYGALDSHPGGLSPDVAAARLTRYGPNRVAEARQRPLFARFFANFTHLMALLLWAGGLIGFIAQMPQLGAAIWMVNIVNGVFSFWQEFRAERATAALRRILPAQARVRRGGADVVVAAETLVPGDVLLLGEGDRISADARVTDEVELRVDQSTFTGEPHPVRKTRDSITSAGRSRAELSNLLFAGTCVVTGIATAVVIATGMETQFGRIAALTQSVADEQSPLQKELGRATRIVTALAVCIGAIFFVLSLALAGMSAAESFIFAMGMIVAFVPEGMLPTVTLALAMGTQRMARRNALVKRLSAVETLGCASVICTDKTGTLTENEMTVRDVWLPSGRFRVTGAGYSPEGALISEDGADPATAHALLSAAVLCNDARLAPPDARASRWTIVGDPTEAALLVAAAKAGLDAAAESRRLPRVRELPFDSRRKRMTTAHREAGDSRADLKVFVKGAPREVLELCDWIADGSGSLPLDGATRARVMDANDDYARVGLRVLAVARREWPGSMLGFQPETVERSLTLLGLIAMMDPPRPEVASAVRLCRRAGVRVIMITGDYGLTAESIARRIGLIAGDDPPPRILTGPELDAMDDGALTAALRDPVIVARAAPENKLRVVSALQQMGHVVAVTGDGVNDAPALKKADIGVAMGRSGSDVAREAADVILADDNFASVVSAIEVGRSVYDNIRKFVTYIFTSNAPEAWPFVFFAFSGGRIPLAMSVMQVLSIDLGTDMVPALALGAEPPEPGVMERPPRPQTERLISVGVLVRSLVFLGSIQGALAMLAFFLMYWLNGYCCRFEGLASAGPLYRAATTMTLGAVVATQIGNLFAQRSPAAPLAKLGRRRLLGNRLIWAGIATELGLLCAILYLPALQAVFGTAPLEAGHWLILVFAIPALPIADEVRKGLGHRRQTQGGVP